jgi:hypothetical protein
MSSKSQNVATQNVVPATKSKGTLFGLSREQLKFVNGGGGIIISNPITEPSPVFTLPGSTLSTPLTTAEPIAAPDTLASP